MHLLYKLLICVFALATFGQGAPKGKDTSKPEDNPGQKFRETPEYLCGHVYKGFYERYYLLGTEWPVHEYLVFEGVVKTPGCVMSNWRWQETTNPETNGYSFNCTFDMPLQCEKKTQKSLNSYLGFRDAKDGGVACPEIKEGTALKKLFKDIGGRRQYCVGPDAEEGIPCDGQGPP